LGDYLLVTMANLLSNQLPIEARLSNKIKHYITLEYMTLKS